MRPAFAASHREDEKRAILENAQKYLGQEQLVTLNAIKHTLRGYETSDVIGEKLAELGEIVDQLRKIRNDMERIATEAERSGNPEVSQIREEMGRLQQEIFHYEERLRTPGDEGLRHISRPERGQ